MIFSLSRIFCIKGNYSSKAKPPFIVKIEGISQPQTYRQERFMISYAFRSGKKLFCHYSHHSLWRLNSFWIRGQYVQYYPSDPNAYSLKEENTTHKSRKYSSYFVPNEFFITFGENAHNAKTFLNFQNITEPDLAI